MSDDYLRLLASFEPALRLERASNLIDPVLATKILTLSGGTIAEISTLLTRAALRAIDGGSERITNANATDAYVGCSAMRGDEHP
jgi:hypothetical protein